MTEVTLIETVSAESLTKLLQDAGLRVTPSEHDRLLLTSATRGVNFNLRLSNPAQGREGEFIDFAFSCSLNVEGELPAGLTDNWNSKRRYGRLSYRDKVLSLQKDVLVAGGISQTNLKGHLEVWDLLLGEFLDYVPKYIQSAAKTPQPHLEAEAEKAL